MRDFKRSGDRSGGFGGGRGGKRSFGGGRNSFGDRGDRPRLEMHEAVCDECQQACEVPFRPSGDKPVYCKSCFDNKGGASHDGGGRRDFGGNRASRYSERTGRESSGTNDGIKKQLEEMNSKLDTLISLLGSKNK